MELETQRVWDYITDSYVHRLIRNRADGKLVELPSLSSGGKGEESDNNKDKDKRGPDKDTEESQDKLEAMGIEYANLMTSQLESQRGYYEEEIARAKDDIAVTRRKWEEALTETSKWRKERVELEKKVDQVIKKAEKDKEEFKLKWEQANKLAVEEEARRKKERLEVVKVRKELEKELEAEKAVTKSLTENLGHLKTEIGKQEKERMELKSEMEELKEQMRDVMFALTARDQIEQQGGAANEAAGGDLMVPATSPATTTPSARRKKKK